MSGSNKDKMMDGREGIGKVYLTGLEERTLYTEEICVSTVGVSISRLFEVKSI